MSGHDRERQVTDSESPYTASFYGDARNEGRLFCRRLLDAGLTAAQLNEVLATITYTYGSRGDLIAGTPGPANAVQNQEAMIQAQDWVDEVTANAQDCLEEATRTRITPGNDMRERASRPLNKYRISQ
jgi:hypothetical protein